MSFTKVVGNFTYQVAIFFLFDEISKMRILEPKNAFWKGAKKHEVKKVIKSKKDFNKSCPKFCKLGDDFFLFWQNLKNEAATAEKRYFDKTSFYQVHRIDSTPTFLKNKYQN